MSEKTAFVSSADRNYYPLLKELLASVNALNIAQNFDIHVLDGGLDPAQIVELETQHITIHDADWPEVMRHRLGEVKDKAYLKGCVLRPFINKIVPGYDMYLWLDSDTWAQTPDGINLLLQGARKGRMCCSILVDRAFPKAARVKWLGPLPFKPRSFYYTNARKAFGIDTAQKLFAYNVVSAGAFAMAGDAPHWERWQDLIGQALQKGNIFTAEQLTLGIMAHLDNAKDNVKYPMEYLPSWCHWPLNYDLAWDEASRLFVEPYLPHQPISILHLSGLDKMRLDPSVTTPVKTISGGEQQMSIRYGMQK